MIFLGNENYFRDKINEMMVDWLVMIIQGG